MWTPKGTRKYTDVCSSPTYIPECEYIQVTPDYDKYVWLMNSDGSSDAIARIYSYWEAPSNCGTRTYEKVPFVGQIGDKEYTENDNAYYYTYICHCNECTYCAGHTERYCPGHRVCAGYVNCQGHSYCPGHTSKICLGHIDVNVTASILGKNENNNLEVNASGLNYNGRTYEDLCKATGFEGWGDTTDALIYTLYNQDWYESFGISPYEITGATLPEDEINDIMVRCNINDKTASPQRQELCKFALQTDGKVPYYWGGDASYLGLDERNCFGAQAPLSISSSGQHYNIKGLDCTGWIGWVYATKGNIPSLLTNHHNTDAWHSTTWADIKPGDPVTRNGHAGIFLGWVTDDHSANGEIYVCHETPNNVEVDHMVASFWNLGPKCLLAD
jgi:hypothetical protein